MVSVWVLDTVEPDSVSLGVYTSLQAMREAWPGVTFAVNLDSTNAVARIAARGHDGRVFARRLDVTGEQVRALRCPECYALVAEELTGPPTAGQMMRCAECATHTMEDVWERGTWIPDELKEAPF